MRCGRINEALHVYRSLVLNPGTTVIRSEADDLTRVNFATALTLKGPPSGAIDVLTEVQDGHFEAAQRLRETILRWSRTLSFWRRMDWKFNRIDPPQCNVPFDEAPGEFSFPVQRKTDAFPVNPMSPDLAA
jgi:hypothetical protein